MSEDDALASLMPYGFSSVDDARGFLQASVGEQARILAALNASTKRDIGQEILAIVEQVAGFAPYGAQIQAAIKIAEGLVGT